MDTMIKEKSQSVISLQSLDAAEDGDTIELEDGVFMGFGNRDIDYSAKAITIRSLSGEPELCIIDCEGSELQDHRGFYFHSGEDVSSVLEDVTVTHGFIQSGEWPLNSGGGILFWQGSPTISNVIFQANFALYAGAISCVGSESSPTFHDCAFLDNNAELSGGSVGCRVSSPSFFDCGFYGNTAHTGGGNC